MGGVHEPSGGIILRGIFSVEVARPSGWFHVVLNYIGRIDGEGFRVYHDGVLVGNATWKRQYDIYPSQTVGESNGIIAVGTLYYAVDLSRYYTSMQIDELVMFNETLDPDEITMLAGRLCNYSGRTRIYPVPPPRSATE